MVLILFLIGSRITFFLGKVGMKSYVIFLGLRSFVLNSGLLLTCY